MSKEIVGVILAGGQSRRMGTDKAFLEIGGVVLIERILKVLLPIFPTVAIVAKETQKFHALKKRYRKICLIQDLFPKQHPLGGIYTALHFSGKACFVFACDLPFLNPSLIRFMIHQLNGYDLLIPQSRRGLEPLHALYARRCWKAMEEKIHEKRHNLKTFVQKRYCCVLNSDILHAFDPEELSFLNVNTPAELERAQALADLNRATPLKT